MAIETPAYEVLRRDGKFELRKYTGYITASVEIEAEDYNTAGNLAFGYLADYIFGDNKKKNNIAMTAPVTTQKIESEKIAMTVPVITSRLSKAKYRTSFTMPSAFSIKTLPIPNDPKVKIEETGPFKAAVLTFSGYTSSDKVQQKINELTDWCRKNKLIHTGSASLSRFDAPWKPGFIRHNEVSLNIK